MHVKSEQMSSSSTCKKSEQASSFSSKMSEEASMFSSKESRETSLFSSMFSNVGLETKFGQESNPQRMALKNETNVLKNEKDVFENDLDIFNSKDSQVIRVKDDRDKFEVSLDTSQYRPDEIKIHVGEGIISVEGKHEDWTKMVSRQFTRKYSLPAGAMPESVVSNLSSDGVLVITVDKTSIGLSSSNNQLGSPKRTRVPMNLRDTFFTDSFFKSNWEEFENVHESLILRSNNFLDKFLEDSFSTSDEKNVCSLITESQQESNQLEKKISKENIAEQSEEGKESLNMDNLNLNSLDTKFERFSPRRWMLPIFSKLDLKNKFNIHNRYSRDIISHKDDQSMFELKLDISEYEPEEVKVTVSPAGILVEGRHEERSAEGKQTFSRSFTKKYSLPHGVRQEDVISKFASNHVLIISAKKEFAHSDQIKLKDQSKDANISDNNKNLEINVKEHDHRAISQNYASSYNTSSKSVQDEGYAGRNVKIEKVLGTTKYRMNDSRKLENRSNPQDEKSTSNEKNYRTIKIGHKIDSESKPESSNSLEKDVPIKLEPSLKTNNNNTETKSRNIENNFELGHRNLNIKQDTKNLQTSNEVTMSVNSECDRNGCLNISTSKINTNEQSDLKNQKQSRKLNIGMESMDSINKSKDTLEDQIGTINGRVFADEEKTCKSESKAFEDAPNIIKNEQYSCNQVKNEYILHSSLSTINKNPTGLTQIKVKHQTSPGSTSNDVQVKEENNSIQENTPTMVWGIPSILTKNLDLFQTEDNQVIRIINDENKFEVSLDTSQYRPDELRVNVSKGIISVEGKHEEKSEDGRKMVSRQFYRKYSLPAGAKLESVFSNLSSDGVLVITVDKTNLAVNTINSHIHHIGSQNAKNIDVVHKIEESKVPITLRNSFLEDQFFKSTWNNFESIKANMTRESEELWKRIEKEFNQMQSSMPSNISQSESNSMGDSSKMAKSMEEWMAQSESSNMKQSTSSSIKESNKMAKSLEEWIAESKSSNMKQSAFNSMEESDKMTKSLEEWIKESKTRGIANENTMDASSFLDRSMMMPRKWMVPNKLNSKIEQLGIFHTKDSEVIHIKNDQDKFEVSLDTSQYGPDELNVNVGEGIITVEGKHEENSDDGRKMVSRQFSRKYSLPAGAKAESVITNLSSNGVLVISAIKVQMAGQRRIPITSN